VAIRAIHMIVAGCSFWVTVPGRSYRVQTKAQLTDALWQDGVETTATNNAAGVIQPLNQPQRFYRIAVVN
jgi:alpha-D-ribose 1-methylphosphonate 5-triphosphate synthase subunit PhnG